MSENDSVRHQGYGVIDVGNDGAGMSAVEVYQNTLIITRTNRPAEGVVTVHGRDLGVAFRNNLLVNLSGTSLVSVRQDTPRSYFRETCIGPVAPFSPVPVTAPLLVWRLGETQARNAWTKSHWGSLLIRSST